MGTDRTEKGSVPDLLLVLAVILALTGLAGCGEVEADRLYAVRLEGPPVEENWEGSVPLLLKAGGGNVHGVKDPLRIVDPETDPIHTSAASCHHGPPVTAPVHLEIRAFYDDSRLYLVLAWEDPTEDSTPREWRRGSDGWEVTYHEGDGLAILWSRFPGEFGCQESCHVDDWTVRGGSVVDVRSMYLPEGGREEGWIWKAAGGTGEVILGQEGFLTTAGEPYRLVNSLAAADISLGEEVRRAKTFGRGDAPAKVAEGVPTPAYLWGSQPADPLLSAQGERMGKGWRILFSRPLDAGKGRQVFRPGETYPFGIAIFDDTTVNHHIVRDTQYFTLVIPPS